jgi:hypothetical protein
MKEALVCGKITNSKDRIHTRNVRMYLDRIKPKWDNMEGKAVNYR